mgnify:CR=1 FL=1
MTCKQFQGLVDLGVMATEEAQEKNLATVKRAVDKGRVITPYGVYDEATGKIEKFRSR